MTGGGAILLVWVGVPRLGGVIETDEPLPGVFVGGLGAIGTDARPSLLDSGNMTLFVTGLLGACSPQETKHHREQLTPARTEKGIVFINMETMKQEEWPVKTFSGLRKRCLYILGLLSIGTTRILATYEDMYHPFVTILLLTNLSAQLFTSEGDWMDEDRWDDAIRGDGSTAVINGVAVISANIVAQNSLNPNRVVIGGGTEGSLTMNGN